MYATDSFFTLGEIGQAGLLAVAIGFALCTGWIVRHVARGRSHVRRFGLWALLFYAFIWLSPQGFYTYYRLVFDGLPNQWVIGWPPALPETIRILTFTGPPTLSAHGLGALGWMLLFLALWPHRSNCRDAAN